MRSFAVGTMGLALIFCGSMEAARADAPSAEPSIHVSPEALAQSTGSASDMDHSFLIVDRGVNKGESDAVDARQGDQAVGTNGNFKSVESSGNPTDAAGVPVPRAGWIGFFGVLGVIAARQYSRSRRYGARTLMN
jgi:hypothetical protein